MTPGYARLVAAGTMHAVVGGRAAPGSEVLGAIQTRHDLLVYGY